MKGQLFQLKDSEDFDFGLIWTNDENIDTKVVQSEYEKFYNNDDSDAEIGADEFIEVLEKLYPDSKFERVYVEDINP